MITWPFPSVAITPVGAAGGVGVGFTAGATGVALTWADAPDSPFPFTAVTT